MGWPKNPTSFHNSIRSLVMRVSCFKWGLCLREVYTCSRCVVMQSHLQNTWVFPAGFFLGQLNLFAAFFHRLLSACWYSFLFSTNEVFPPEDNGLLVLGCSLPASKNHIVIRWMQLRIPYNICALSTLKILRTQKGPTTPLPSFSKNPYDHGWN